MLCQHNFDGTVRQKNWVACLFYLQVHFKYENRFKVLMFNIFYPNQNINSECAVLLDEPIISHKAFLTQLFLIGANCPL